MVLTASSLVILMVLGSLAGLIGALVGVGGGIVVVPVLVLGYGVDIKVAVASSLVVVVASSTAAGSVYVGKGLANMRLGMVLEVATTIGGICGSFLAALLPGKVVSILFSLIMFVTTFLMLKNKEAPPAELLETKESKEQKGSLDGSYYDPFHKKLVHYKVKRLWLGSIVSYIAGILSGLLGVGGGFFKVPAMNIGMKVPLKVAAATSNLMIGVTAISSLFIYFSKGLVHPLLTAPLVVGVTAGALYGTSIASKISPHLLRKIFAVFTSLIALQMILKAMDVTLGK